MSKSKQCYLLTLAADETDKSNGLKVLLTSLNRNYPSCFDEWNVYVLTPRHFSNRQIKYFKPNSKINYLVIDSEYFESIYFYKTILMKFIRDHCLKNDEILYLDYDHLCTGKFGLPTLDSKTIYVSSEIQKLDSSLSDSIFKSGIRQTCIEYFNTSIIYSMAETFLQATSNWKKYGRLFEEKIKSRNAEEITFTLSAQNYSFDIIPVSLKIQSNWTNLSMSPLFHYGGEEIYAKAFKKFLNQPDSPWEKKLIEQSSTLVRYYSSFAPLNGG